MQVCDPNSPEGYLNIQTVENEEFGEEVPATVSIEKQRDFYDGSMISSVTYFAYGKAKQTKFEEWKDVKMSLTALPPVNYPKDFSDTMPEGFKDWADYKGVCAVIGLTNDSYRKMGYSTPFTFKYVTIYQSPDLYGYFRIRDNLNADPNERDHPATFSVTELHGMNAGETISSVTYYAFGKQKVFDNLSIYDPKDIPEARYPVGFTETNNSLTQRIAMRRGEVWVRVTTSKASEPFRTIFLDEEYPDKKGTATFTYDEDMSYATYDHPVKLSLENFSGLAYNEEVTAISYKLIGRGKEVTFTKEDNPELFADGLPSAVYPNDFYDERRLDHGGNIEATFSVTITVQRKSVKQESAGKTTDRDRYTGIGSSRGYVNVGDLINSGRIGGSLDLGDSGIVGGSVGHALTEADSNDLKSFVSSMIKNNASTRELTFWPENSE